MTKWTKWVSREGVDITTLVEVDRAFYGLLREFTGKSREVLFTTLKDRLFTHYTKFKPEEFGRFLYRKYFNSEKDIKNFIRNGNRILSQTLVSARKWEKAIVGSRDADKIISALKTLVTQFEDVNYYYSIMSFAAIEAWQKDFQEIFEKMIKRGGLENRQSEISEAISEPWKKSALLSLQEKLKNSRNLIKLVKEYQYLRSWSLVWYEPITTKTLTPQNTINKTLRSHLNRQDAINLLQPTVQEKKFLELAPYIIYLKDWRDDLRRKQAYHWSFLFHAAARHLGVLKDDLGYLSLQEILDAFGSNNFYKKLINRRKNSLCVIASNNPEKIAMMVFCGQNMSKYLKITKETAEKNIAGEIMGFIAQKGKATGRVQIIRSAKDIISFRKGSILVANSTHPNYLSAMNKSAAIITNEGGIASHAAIVARELRIPCIVGTNNATRVLKDGDLVEVDAYKGVVKKIE